MKKRIEDKSPLDVLLGLCLALAIIYGMYWLFKTTSYWFFYESMVKNTITETVLSECLR